jgi:hypothetical protein
MIGSPYPLPQSPFPNPLREAWEVGSPTSQAQYAGWVGGLGGGQGPWSLALLPILFQIRVAVKNFAMVAA